MIDPLLSGCRPRESDAKAGTHGQGISVGAVSMLGWTAPNGLAERRLF
jgi:hypothetical protein